MVKSERSLLSSLMIAVVFIVSTAMIILITQKRNESTDYRSQAAYGAVVPSPVPTVWPPVNPTIAPGGYCSFAENTLPHSCANCQYGWPSGINANNPSGKCKGPNIFVAVGQAAGEVVGNIIKTILPANGIGKGEDVGCPEGTTQIRGPNGLVWCD